VTNASTDRKALADRLEACVKQIGQPDYSLGDLYRDCLEIAADMRGLPSLSGPSHEDRVFCLEDALRPFAMQADTMYHLKDGDKVCGMYVAWFRTAAQMMNEAADRSSATHSEGETK
jgi:hypothetical protein